METPKITAPFVHYDPVPRHDPESPHCDGCGVALPAWWIVRCHECGRLYPAMRKPPRRVRNRIFARDGRRCLRCGARKELTIDHIIPFALGGTHEDDNLQTLCRPCNEEKGDSVQAF